jgi:hypothetical protein
MKTIFLTFGGPSEKYHKAVDRICIEAKKLNLFDQINGLNENNLFKDTNFWNNHKDFILKNEKGYGYWIWKSYIVKKQLELMDENDILLYCDAGCEINLNGKNRLLEYFKMIIDDDYGILSFQLNLKEKEFTKMDVINYFNASDIQDTGMLIATTFIIRKCSHSIDLINKWYESCCNYNLLNDNSVIENDSSFKAHRHDQSIFSIIRKKYGTTILPDETYFFPSWNSGEKFPILAKRLR